MIEGPLLWFLNRGTGFTLVALLTLTVVLGVLSARGRVGRWIPAFVSQSLHRTVSLLALTLLAAHVLTAVADDYVDIRWWQAVVPVGSSYEPLWLGVGAVALDLFLAIAVTSLVRARIGHRRWLRVHRLAYGAWALGVVHGFMIGTDSQERWALLTYAGSLAVVVLAVGLRLLPARSPARPTTGVPA